MTSDWGSFHASDRAPECGDGHVSSAREAGAAVRPWAHWRVGERVMVRIRIEDKRHKYSDILGYIESVSASELVVRRRDDSLVRVPVATIVTGKRIPPPPARRRARG